MSLAVTRTPTRKGSSDVFAPVFEAERVAPEAAHRYTLEEGAVVRSIRSSACVHGSVPCTICAARVMGSERVAQFALMSKGYVVVTLSNPGGSTGEVVAKRFLDPDPRNGAPRSAGAVQTYRAEFSSLSDLCAVLPGAMRTINEHRAFPA